MTRGQRGTLAMPNCAAASAIWFGEVGLASRKTCVGLVRQPGVCVCVCVCVCVLLSLLALLLSLLALLVP